MGVASLAKETLHGLSFYNLLPHKIQYVFSDRLHGGGHHRRPVLFTC